MSPRRILPFKDRAVAHVQDEGTGREVEYRISGNPGLVLVVQKPNRLGLSEKSFRVYYTCRLLGKATRRKMRIGSYPSITLAEARKQAADVKRRVELGEDPAARAKPPLRSSDLSFSGLASAYLDDHRGLASFVEMRRELMKDAVSAFRDLPANSITPGDVDRLARSIADRGAPAIARRTIARIKAIYNYAILDAPRLAEQFELTVNPAQGLGRRRRAVQQYASAPRTRVLSDTEIVRFWQTLEASGMLPCSQLALQLILVSGQRSGEIRQARKIDFQLSGALPTWTIPAAHSKNGRTHVVPLAPLALRVVSELFSRYPSSPLLLSRPTEMSKVRSKSALPSAMMLFCSRHLPNLAPATPHDLRRTFATGCRRLHISRYTVQQLLNHSRRDVTASYDHFDGLTEKEEASKRWCLHVERLIGRAETSEARLIA